jgi:asparagine synthase (glutamine-hydrolysing)
MCGIAGLFDASRAPANRTLLQRMGDAIVHRGPDQAGDFSEPGVGLVARRLRIIDLEGGAQPISNEDGSVTVVFNGEIYNFQQLRADLERRGHRFSTRTDTEVIVHLYEDRGENFVTSLRGMFAIALWDATRQRGMLARDRLGKKPLVYAHVGQRLLFASEFQALLQSSEISRALDLGALGDYLAYGYVPAPASIYRAARKLPPGHHLVWQRGEINVGPYWRLEYLPKLRLTESEAEEELEHHLAEAVRLRLIADVPVGALLSGGIDSSTVVALMARFAPGRVKTFSIGFDDAAYDELAHARRVAERYDTDHHEFVVKPNAAGVLPMLVRHYGEPYADSSAIPTYYACRLARQFVTVALNGDGGDETFAGYDRDRAMAWSELMGYVPGLRWGATLAERMWAPYASRPGARRHDARVLKFLRGLRMTAGSRYSYWTSNIEDHVLLRLLSPDCASEVLLNRSRAVERTWASGTHLSRADRVLFAGMMTSLPNDLLVKMDIASMASSLETRSPFLDHEVVEFAARLPANLKLRYGMHRKYLLKRLARRFVPAQNIDRPKMGFGVPVGGWLRGSLQSFGADVLFSQRARQRGYFRPDTVAHLWTEHQSGTKDNAYPLWMLLMFELWHNEFVDAPCGRRELPIGESVGEKR